MRLIAVLVLCSCARVSMPDDAEARRACTSEGMWCQDAEHSRCCRGLRCVDSACVKRERGQQPDRQQL